MNQSPHGYAHLAPLLKELPEEGERLQRLLEKAGPFVRIMSETALRALERGVLGRNGQGVLEFEAGIAKVTLRPAD